MHAQADFADFVQKERTPAGRFDDALAVGLPLVAEEDCFALKGGTAIDLFPVAQRLVGDAPNFISHASAMEIHRMVTQAQFVIFASSTKRVPGRTLNGTEFRFVLIKPDHFFGTTKHWVTKQESVDISDLERTIIDGLRQPEYCGGVTEVAKGLWMRHADMQAAKLVDYALRLHVGAVTRRLGYLLELYRIAPEHELARLRQSLTLAYQPLDPILPREGLHVARWRLQVNISPDELEGVRAT